MASAALTERGQAAFTLVAALGNGFIITAMTWGAALAFLIDRRLVAAAVALFTAAVLAAFGVIHSVQPTGGVYWPWASGNDLSVRFALGYALFGGLVLLLRGLTAGRRTPSSPRTPPDSPAGS